jgi:hypothetical protein
MKTGQSLNLTLVCLLYSSLADAVAADAGRAGPAGLGVLAGLVVGGLEVALSGLAKTAALHVAPPVAVAVAAAPGSRKPPVGSATCDVLGDLGELATVVATAAALPEVLSAGQALN